MKKTDVVGRRSIASFSKAGKWKKNIEQEGLVQGSLRLVNLGRREPTEDTPRGGIPS